MPNILDWLQDWYGKHTDGEWEEDHGLIIETIENPGWALRVDLEGTELEGRQFPDLKVDRDERDWFHCRVRKGRFEGFGGPRHLRTLLEVFRAWAEGRDVRSAVPPPHGAPTEG